MPNRFLPFRTYPFSCKVNSLFLHISNEDIFLKSSKSFDKSLNSYYKLTENC